MMIENLTMNRETDPYQHDNTKIKEPPTRLLEIGKYLGPGFVLSAAIVGSGELIAATALGARAGFITFWVILVSCMVKVVLQLEFGKHAIHSGETTMASLNLLPGMRLGKGNWSIWVWLFIQLFKLLQVGGIVGGVAITLNFAFPFISVTVWALAVTIFTSALISRGYYQFIEKSSLIMIGIFTLLTLACTYMLQFTPFSISQNEVFEGLSFQLPAAYVGIALAAFGITGVGGDEIMYYNYWCIEKGYAAYSGKKEDSDEWTRRAKGWIRIMYIDAILAMVVYTIVTAAFYLLGAAVLHDKGSIPEGYEMVETLSQMYTETLGPWAKSLFVMGAIVVLYSTMFTATASFTRIFSDAFSQIGLFDFQDLKQRKKVVFAMAWGFPMTWCLLFLFIKLPVLMILIGGFVTSILLLLVVYVAIYFRYKRLPKVLKPTLIYDIVFWISALSILMVGLYGIIKVIA